MTIFGTRPEAIKMAPLLKSLEMDDRFHSQLCITAQHREMLDQVLNLFEIVPDYDLDVMEKGQSLSTMTSRMIDRLSEILEQETPDFIFVHGDTATTLCGALSGFYQQIPIIHIEAGLRTGDIYSPWPEEGNRKLVTAISRLHFAPTEKAAENLRLEGVDNTNIHISGNTVIDSLLLVIATLNDDSDRMRKISSLFPFLDPEKKLILVTAHRRESFGGGFERICSAIKQIADHDENVQIVFPVHLNPTVSNPVRHYLSEIENVFLIAPQDYLPFVYLMKQSDIILTDSGGIQEEAPSLGKPVLVMRDTTERPEAVLAGTVKLVGTDEDKILSEVKNLLENHEAYEKMSVASNPYGDGNACERIIKVLGEYIDRVY